MYNSDRENEILAAIKANGYVSVKDLASMLSISESSIRRDLADLHSKRLISRKHGGAEAIDSVTKIIPYSHRYQLGKIEKKKISFTKNNKTMAYISIEDLTGTVEVIIFPRDYERYQRYLNEDEKVFVVGHASVEDDKDGKIICERIVPFDETGCDVWLQFATMEEYKEKEKILMDILYDSDGNDEVVLYIATTRQKKRLGKNQTIKADGELLATLGNFLGEKNVKVVEKSIEN